MTCSLSLQELEMTIMIKFDQCLLSYNYSQGCNLCNSSDTRYHSHGLALTLVQHISISSPPRPKLCSELTSIILSLHHCRVHSICYCHKTQVSDFIYIQDLGRGWVALGWGEGVVADPSLGCISSQNTDPP